MEGISAKSGFSVLAYANKQPELALQLLQKTLEGAASSENMQSPTAIPAPASSTNTTTGRIIDIRA